MTIHFYFAVPIGSTYTKGKLTVEQINYVFAFFVFWKAKYKDRNYTLEYQGREQHILSKHPIEPFKLKINDRHSDR